MERRAVTLEASIAAPRPGKPSIAENSARRRTATNVNGRNRQNLRHKSGVRGNAGEWAFGIHELSGNFEGYFATRMVPPTTADHLAVNPLGLYVTTVNWTQLADRVDAAVPASGQAPGSAPSVSPSDSVSDTVAPPAAPRP